MTDIIFRETTTIGLRYYEVDRECLEREIVPVETPLGAVRFKIASRDGRRDQRGRRNSRTAPGWPPRTTCR